MYSNYSGEIVPLQTNFCKKSSDLASQFLTKKINAVELLCVLRRKLTRIHVLNTLSLAKDTKINMASRT